MRGAAKGEEPEELRAWKAGQTTGAGLQPRYHDLRGDVRELLQRQLFLEQTGQCMYCGRQIRLEDHNDFHVEHFRPRRQYPELEVAHENLFLSCGSRRPGKLNAETCGHRKNGWFEEDSHVPPTPEQDCQGRFVFGLDGRIRSNGTPAARKMIEVLNLNHTEFVSDRSALLEAVEAALEEVDRKAAEGNSLEREVSELISDYSGVGSEGTRGSFAHVAVRYLHQYPRRS